MTYSAALIHVHYAVAGLQVASQRDLSAANHVTW